MTRKSARTIVVIPQRQHQLMDDLRVLVASEPGLLRRLREAKVGQAGRDDVEARVVGRRLGQQREELPHFQEMPGPYTTISNIPHTKT